MGLCRSSYRLATQANPLQLFRSWGARRSRCRNCFTSSFHDLAGQFAGLEVQGIPSSPTASSANIQPTVVQLPEMSTCPVEPANAVVFALFIPLHCHPALPLLPCHPQHCHHSQPAFFLFPLTLPPVEQEQPRPRACSPACRVLYKICLVLLCFPFLLPWPAAFTRSLAASFCCPPVAAPLVTTRPAATSPLPPGVSA